jgi:hypothetical protein
VRDDLGGDEQQGAEPVDEHEGGGREAGEVAGDADDALPGRGQAGEEDEPADVAQDLENAEQLPVAWGVAGVSGYRRPCGAECRGRDQQAALQPAAPARQHQQRQQSERRGREPVTERSDQHHAVRVLFILGYSGPVSQV